MWQYFKHGERLVSYELSYRPRKTIGIRIEGNGDVCVIAPAGLDNTVIMESVRRKAAWIIRKQDICRAAEAQTSVLFQADGHNLFFLGQKYKLKITETGAIQEPQVQINQVQEIIAITMQTMDESIARKALTDWYHTATRAIITERLALLQCYFSVIPSKIIVKEQKRRWASCSAVNVLRFNWRLAMAPLPVVDYVIVHEMSHTVQRNHSRAFWNVVSSVLPDWKERRRWLKNNGMQLKLYDELERGYR